jgi:nucleoside-diphosphate-sugar epimerase
MQHHCVLILGLGGFVGSHLTDRILRTSACRIEGWDVSFDKLLGNLGNPRLALHRQYIDAETTWAELEPVIDEVDAVISLAAVCTPANYVASPIKTIRSNFIDAYRLVDLCAKHRKWLIHTSTCEVYGRTISSYVPGENYSNSDLYEQ